MLNIKVSLLYWLFIFRKQTALNIWRKYFFQNSGKIHRHILNISAQNTNESAAWFLHKLQFLRIFPIPRKKASIVRIFFFLQNRWKSCRVRIISRTTYRFLETVCHVGGIKSLSRIYLPPDLTVTNKNFELFCWKSQALSSLWKSNGCFWCVFLVDEHYVLRKVRIILFDDLCMYSSIPVLSPLNLIYVFNQMKIKVSNLYFVCLEIR